MSIKPLQLAFYKGMSGKFGAIQFNLQRPHYYVKQAPKFKNYDGRFIRDSWKDSPDWDDSITDQDLVSREGALFMEITSTKGKNEYDWDKKIVMALSIQDMSEILMVLEGLQEECKIMHDPGAKTASQGKVNKYLVFSSPKGFRKGCLVSASQTAAGGDTNKHMVPLSGSEARRLAILIRYAIPVALAW